MCMGHEHITICRRFSMYAHAPQTSACTESVLRHGNYPTCVASSRMPGPCPVWLRPLITLSLHACIRYAGGDRKQAKGGGGKGAASKGGDAEDSGPAVEFSMEPFEKCVCVHARQRHACMRYSAKHAHVCATRLIHASP